MGVNIGSKDISELMSSFRRNLVVYSKRLPSESLVVEVFGFHFCSVQSFAY